MYCKEKPSELRCSFLHFLFSFCVEAKVCVQPVCISFYNRLLFYALDTRDELQRCPQPFKSHIINENISTKEPKCNMQAVKLHWGCNEPCVLHQSDECTASDWNRTASDRQRKCMNEPRHVSKWNTKQYISTEKRTVHDGKLNRRDEASGLHLFFFHTTTEWAA